MSDITKVKTSNVKLKLGKKTDSLKTGKASTTEIKKVDVEDVDFNSDVKKADIKLTDVYKSLPKSMRKILSTGAVVTDSVQSGILKLGEHVMDFGALTGGKIAEGTLSLAATITNNFDKKASNKITDKKEKMKDTLSNFIKTDQVSKLKKEKYEGTSLGKAIDKDSLIKYNSKTAKKISDISEKGGEIAVSTGLTILTGGIAAPAILGASVGAGKGAEKAFTKNSNFDKGTGVILVNSALTGMEWAANGKFFSGLYNIGKDIADIGLKETGLAIKENASSFLSDEQFRKKTIELMLDKVKDSSSLTKINNTGKTVANLNGIMNLASSGMMMGNDILDIYNGNEKLNYTTIAKLGLKFIKNYTFNVTEDVIRDNVSAYKNGDIKDAIEKTFDENTTDAAVSFRTKRSLMQEIRKKKIYKKLSPEEIDTLADLSETVDDINYRGSYADKIASMNKLESKLNSLQDNGNIKSVRLGLKNSTDLCSFYLNNFNNQNEELFQTAIAYADTDTVENYIENLLKNPDMKYYGRKVLENIYTYRFPNNKVTNLKDFSDLADYYYDRFGIDIEDYPQNKSTTTLLKCLNNKDAMINKFKNFIDGRVDDNTVESASDVVACGESSYFKRNPSVVGYNDGKESVVRPGSKNIVQTMIHESMHQVSTSSNGTGVEYVTKLDGKTKIHRRGLNEAITELFSKKIHGSTYKSDDCAYNPAVKKLQQIVDAGVIDMEDLKDEYFVTHDIDKLKDNIESLGIDSEEYVNAFNLAISDYDKIRNKGLKALTTLNNKMIKTLNKLY